MSTFEAINPPDFLLAKYERVEMVGFGAHGTVYRCESAECANAVKILNPFTEDVRRVRFLKEIEILKRIDHKYVVKLLDAGENDGRYWYESEYASESHFGKMFPYLIYNDYHRVEYLAQVCQGLLALHKAKVIHRDIKPHNILVFQSRPDNNITLKIADFGLATMVGDLSQITSTSASLGTWDYMAPERRQNPKTASIESDIYARGVTFLEAFTGQSVVHRDNVGAVSPLMRPIIEKMINLHPEDRFHSVQEVLEELSKPSLSMLFVGRELEPGEPSSPVFSHNLGGSLQRQVEILYSSTNETVESSISSLEAAMDRLGRDVHDNKGQTIGSIPIHVLKLLNEVRPYRLLNLIRNFSWAIENTTEQDHFYAGSDHWALFLVEVYRLASDAQTKWLCLETLVSVMERFDRLYIRGLVFELIRTMDDPTDMAYLADCFREHMRDDIANLLIGDPHGDPVDEEALRTVLSKATNEKT